MSSFLGVCPSDLSLLLFLVSLQGPTHELLVLGPILRASAMISINAFGVHCTGIPLVRVGDSFIMVMSRLKRVA